MLGNHPPECTGIRGAHGFSLVEDGRAAIEERAVDDIGMPDHPADIGSSPEDLAGLHAIDILHAPEQGNEMAAIIPEHPFGFSGSPRCVEEVERIRCRYRDTALPVQPA